MKKVLESLLDKIDNIKNVLYNNNKQVQPVPVVVRKHNKF
jgi:hypothetical protein